MSLNPKEQKPSRTKRKTKSELAHEEYNRLNKTIRGYADREGHRWWDLDRGWREDRQAESDSEALQHFLAENINYETHRSGHSTDVLEIRKTKAFFSQRRESRRLARMAAHLEDHNFHASANYIRDVMIAGAPEDIYLKKRKRYREVLGGA